MLTDTEPFFFATKAMISRIVRHLPEEVENLFNVVKVRNLGQKLGFEKIIIKNGLQIMFFISNPMSPYYKSPVFDRIIERINTSGPTFTLKQKDGKLRIVTRNVDSMEKACSILLNFS